ncbi:MAG: energy-coupling factor transporter transmembrane protein EcfT, partial [Spirochaetia bacterium]|nr:energy-coupling factor transporter transmembrane protein EcfT [Spirochaetia bacterium]
GRFFLIVWTGLILMDTTSPEKSSQAIYAFMRPLPGVNRGKAAAQFLLTITFIPLVFDSAREIREARYSRGENPKRRPFRFLLSFTAQLFDVLFLKAEEISMALLSREFQNSMYPGKLTFHLQDAAAIVFSIFTAAAAFGGSWILQNL